MAARTRMRTPIRHALRDNSTLHRIIEDGIGAVIGSHRNYLALTIRGAFGDSLNLDAAFRRARPNENRWDYLLGHTASKLVVGIEPHSAKDDEITTVINKRSAAMRQLAGHFKHGAKVSKWIWVASRTVRFADTEIARRRLDQNGIAFAGAQVLAKHLPAFTAKKARKGK